MLLLPPPAGAGVGEGGTETPGRTLPILQQAVGGLPPWARNLNQGESEAAGQKRVWQWDQEPGEVGEGSSPPLGLQWRLGSHLVMDAFIWIPGLRWLG